MANEATKPAPETSGASVPPVSAVPAAAPPVALDVKSLAAEVAGLLKEEYLAKQKADEALIAAHQAEVTQHKNRAEKLFAALLKAQIDFGEIEQLPDVNADHRGWLARTAIANISAVLGA